MKNQRPFVTLTLCMMISACATTQTQPTNTPNDVTPFSAQGWGGTTCEELIHDITPKNVGFQQAVQNIRLYQSWTSGFVSGVNYANDDVYDVSGGTSPEDAFSWLKEYCTENTDVAIPVALHQLLQIWQQEGKALTEAQE